MSEVIKNRGRPSGYNPELAEKICQLIEQGYSERQICLMDGMPCVSTLGVWKGAHPEYLELSVRAREQAADYFDDKRREANDKLHELALEAAQSGMPIPKGVVEASYTPDKTRSYEQCIALFARQAMAATPPQHCALRVTVIAAFPVPKSYSKKRRAACLQGCERPAKKPDLDNVLKAILDACNGVVWADDAQIVGVVASKTYTEVPSVRILVQEA